MTESNRSYKARPTSYASFLVSLYLVLLTFFIVIHSMSRTHVQRTDDAIESVHSSFGPKGYIPKEKFILPVPGKSDYQRQSDRYDIDQIKVIFEETFGLSSDAMEGSGNRLHIKIPLSYFFEGDSISMRTLQRRFLERVSHTIKQSEKTFPIQIQCMIGVNRLEDVSVEKDLILPIRRANAIATYLQNHAVSPQLIQTGLIERDQGFVVFEFETFPLTAPSVIGGKR